MKTEYGCYVKSKKGKADCRLCDKPIQYGDGYARIFINGMANPYFHAGCLEVASQAANAEKAKIAEYEAAQRKVNEAKAAALAEQKAESKKHRDNYRFKKQIIKDALKTQDILVSRLSITCWGSDRDFQIANAVDLIFEGDAVTVINHNHRHMSSRVRQKRKRILLADPNALTLLGEIIMSKDNGNIARYKRQKK